MDSLSNLLDPLLSYFRSTSFSEGGVLPRFSMMNPCLTKGGTEQGQNEKL